MMCKAGILRYCRLRVYNPCAKIRTKRFPLRIFPRRLAK
uniref:Uncharacterized protein n=1 Tax=Anguilla anguilla TaxID=7936 RepID=A0A0E9W5F3_ANGAN